MKIAFASCMSTNSFPNKQIVWEQIAKHQPQALVLLGDSVYNDVPHCPDSTGITAPWAAGYNDNDFATHLHDLYRRQLAIPEFAKLIKTVPTYAIWDDHDFLWNNAGQAQADGVYDGELKAIYSSNLFACWRSALTHANVPTAGAAFPVDVSQPTVQNNVDAYSTHNPTLPAYSLRMPGYSSQILFAGDAHIPKIILHLTDGRSWRKGKTLLGAAQRKQLQDAFEAERDAVHLVASGSTFGAPAESGENWNNYSVDTNWLISMAAQYKIVLLSGDIHQNRLPNPVETSTAKKLYEVTSSGAAVDFLRKHQDAGATGAFNFSQNYGLLEFKKTGIEISLYHHGRMELGQPKVIPYTFEADHF